MSSGEAFLLTSCSSRMASAISMLEDEARESLESPSPASLAVEPCLLPKHDRELERELEREFDLERDLDVMETERSRVLMVSTALSFFCMHGATSKAGAVGERSASLICWRPSGLRSTGLGEAESSGTSGLGATGGELEFVLGLESLWA